MSELINVQDNRATIRWKLLAGASALVLSAYMYSADLARAEDSDRPPLWIELGGQVEQLGGTSAKFSAPFMTALSPAPGPYSGDIFVKGQKTSRFSVGGEGKVTIQPDGSDWVFSASIRYGRANNNKHIHHQSPTPPATKNGQPYHFISGTKPFADIKSSYSEQHMIVDFTAGRDVGLGRFGRDGKSAINVGLELDDFVSKNYVDAMGRPLIHFYRGGFGYPIPTFYNYTMAAHAERSFRGMGPTFQWEASAALLGDKSDGELSLDWGVQGALLFGRQRAKLDHTTQAYHQPYTYYIWYRGWGYTKIYDNPHPANRSRSVTVPKLGGFAGLSWRTTHAKVSIGYRYETFLNAMDTGIDARKTSNVSFSGPYASFSIGLGG
jgi:hypothetical protein